MKTAAPVKNAGAPSSSPHPNADHMTTPVAGAPASIARDDVLGLVAWNTGHGWTAQHVELQGGETLCGKIIPKITRIDRRSVVSDDLCRTCIDMAVVA